MHTPHLLRGNALHIYRQPVRDGGEHGPLRHSIQGGVEKAAKRRCVTCTPSEGPIDKIKQAGCYEDRGSPDVVIKDNENSRPQVDEEGHGGYVIGSDAQALHDRQ